MSDKIHNLSEQLIQEAPKQINSKGVIIHDFEYKQFGKQPKLTLSGLSLCILSPALMVIHIQISRFSQIPMIQICFVGMLVGFIINYTMIIRKYELMPYLSKQVYDNKLKKICVIGLCALICSFIFGWNGSGGIIFAMIWQHVRGRKIQFYGGFFLIIIVGSLLMEDHWNLVKLIQFIPGVLFGYVCTILFTLKDSQTYTITHQWLFLCTIALPMFYPAMELIVPSIWQWLIMIIMGTTILFTTICTVKLIQSQRVSIVMAMISAILMVGTTHYISIIDYIGCVVILIGVGLIIKKEYLDVHY